jgi:hypothetical protein
MYQNIVINKQMFNKMKTKEVSTKSQFNIIYNQFFF